MKKPIASRSAASSSSAAHAATAGSDGATAPPPPPPKRPICEDARSSARLAAQRMTSSSPARRRARLRSIESKAPHLIRLSITRRLTSWPRTRRQKSARLVNGPSSRAARTASIAFERSEEHTSELQSQSNLVCRLLLEKKKKQKEHRTSLTH